SIPVVTCRNITAKHGERILARGDTDLIAIGRGLIADPELDNKLREERARDVQPCIRCNQLCNGNDIVGRAIVRAVKPEIGHEGDRGILAADDPRRIVVIGAGPAGMEFARVAGARGHRVDVYEQRHEAGGVLLPAATPEFKRELRRMIPWWERQLAQLDTVELHLGTRLGPDDQRLADADTV